MAPRVSISICRERPRRSASLRKNRQCGLAPTANGHNGARHITARALTRGNRKLGPNGPTGYMCKRSASVDVDGGRMMMMWQRWDVQCSIFLRRQKRALTDPEFPTMWRRYCSSAVSPKPEPREKPFHYHHDPAFPRTNRLLGRELGCSPRAFHIACLLWLWLARIALYFLPFRSSSFTGGSPPSPIPLVGTALALVNAVLTSHLLGGAVSAVQAGSCPRTDRH